MSKEGLKLLNPKEIRACAGNKGIEHETIYFDNPYCPLCAMCRHATELTEKVSELEGDIADLQQRAE